MSVEQRINPEKKDFNIEVRDQGDTYIINGLNSEKLLDLAIEIGELLNQSPLPPNSKKDLQEGNDLRPGGCFRISFYKNKLQISNTNARGYEPMTIELKKAIETATNKV